MTSEGKTSTDIHMVLDIVDLLQHQVHYDEFIVFSADADFTPVLRKLRRGHWVVQAAIDLHGLISDEARVYVATFLNDCKKRGLRCVRIVHGKGLGSPGKTPVLKGKVHSWLVQKTEVMAFVQARPAEGGAGAYAAVNQ